MARSVTKIGTYVARNTGRTLSDSQLTDFCDEALRVALNVHPFADSISIESIEISEGDSSVDISSISDIIHTIAVQAIDKSGESSRPIIMKDKVWWNRNVVDADQRRSDWPRYGHRAGNIIDLNCKVNRDLTIKVIVSTVKTYEDTTSPGPIDTLDIFVGHYVTAMAFLSLQDDQAYQRWKTVALGHRWDVGEVGGSLANAIASDKFDLSTEMRASYYSDDVADFGLSVRNLNSSHDDYNNIQSWY